MNSGLPLVPAIYAFSSAAGLGLGYVVWRHREKTGARPLLGSIVGGWWWSTALLLATVSSSHAVSAWMLRSLYVGVVIVVASIFLFALAYTGREHLVTRWTIALLSVQPVIVVCLAFANPRNVFFRSLAPDPSAATGVAPVWGIGFWLHAAYSYGLTLAATALIVGMLFRTRSLYRGQIVVLLAAVLAPTVGNLGHIVGPVPFDSTPLGFIAANGLFTLAITRYRFIEITPIARDRVIDTVGDAMFVVDREGRLVDVNAAGRSIADEHGVGDVRLVGRTADDLLEGLPALRELYHEIVAGEEERTTEFSRAGRHFEITATPVTGGQGRVLGWLFLVSDVTHRTRRERELRRRNEQLDQFARVVSHDLRNPIAVAEGYAELARETGDLDHLEEVTDALERMEAIVDDVLALARDEGDAKEVTSVDVGSVAEDAWGNVETGGAALDVVESTTIRAERGRLSRLLENLFRNAIEHGTVPGDEGDGDEQRGLRVEVGICAGGDAATTGFYVADDGPGIPADERERIFEMGYTSSADGTGFGLNIVTQIADVHEWDVRATESDSGGARIEITGVEPADSRARVRRTGP